MSEHVKQGVVIMNLGSPDSTSVPDVKRYLDEFLMDKRVIDSPWLTRAMLVKGIIVPFRAPKSAKAYKSVWTGKGSPLIVLSKELKNRLQRELQLPVEIAMRYGSPSPKAAYDTLLQANPEIEEVILLPLYPHYAMSSYETAVAYAKEQHQKGGYRFKLTVIRPYYEHPFYLNALAESIAPFLKQEYDHILFSYHGVPERHIYKGDITGRHCLQRSDDCCSFPSPAHKQCYRHQCFFTTHRMAEVLDIPFGKYSLSFQSRLGRSQWLKPYTAERLKLMPAAGYKKLLVVCPAFASDCLETLEEIAVEGKHIFMEAGGESFTMIPCLNYNAAWVEAIRLWVEQLISGNREMELQ